MSLVTERLRVGETLLRNTLELSSRFNGTVQFIIYYCQQTTPLVQILTDYTHAAIPTHEVCKLRAGLLKTRNVFCETEE
jgi:hypothetical protein